MPNSIFEFPAKTPPLSRLVIALAILFQSGCVTLNKPGDLRLISLSAVDYHDQAELPFPNVAEAHAGVSEEVGLGAPENMPHETLLLAKFSSATDLSQLSDAVTLGVDSYLCQRPGARVLLNLPYIFSRGRDVRLGSIPDVGQTAAEQGPPFTYDVYFRSSRTASIPSRPQEESFDLNKNPEDICFKIVGGAYRRLGFSSNAITRNNWWMRCAKFARSATVFLLSFGEPCRT